MLSLSFTSMFDVEKFRNQNDFLNHLIQNVTSAIFFADEERRITGFNNSFRVLFHKREDEILGQKCGDVLGCAHHVEQGVQCGETDNCDFCPLRKSIEESLEGQKNIFKKSLIRNFYVKNQKIRKFFLYSTRFFEYQGEETALVILDDVTEIEEKRLALEHGFNSVQKRLVNSSNKIQLLEDQLNDADEKNDTLIHELHHRIGNSMQTLISLLSLQGMYTPDEALAATINNASRYMSALKSIYSELLHAENLLKIDQNRFLPLVLSHLQSNTGFAIEDMRLKIPKFFLTLDQSLPFHFMIWIFLLNNYAGKDVLELTCIKQGQTLITSLYLSIHDEFGILADDQEDELNELLLTILGEQLHAKTRIRNEAASLFYEIEFPIADVFQPHEQ
jgi:hypothetical protein